MKEDAPMGSPAITLRCDCGEQARSAYGEVWTCPKCDRVYDTSKIPADDYAAVAALDRRYRRGSRGLMAVLALVVLAVAVSGNIVSIFAGLAVVLLSWFLYIKPIIHRRHRKAVSNLTRRWELKAE
ncbi:MAG: hypothetical protein QOG33_209 [Gaiellales bacterium]|jgi:hypothetical protein|nr:hypothetical protein [Gaiellales bacterium]